MTNLDLTTYESLVNLVQSRPGLLLTLGEKWLLCRSRACPGLKSMDCQTSRVSTGDSLRTRCCPEVLIIIFTKSFIILAEIPLGNSTFMAKDGPDTSAGRPRCETSNFGIYAVLTLEADMVKTCENNKLVGIKSGLVLTRFLDESSPKISTFNFTVLFTNVRGICFNFLQVFTD